MENDDEPAKYASTWQITCKNCGARHTLQDPLTDPVVCNCGMDLVCRVTIEHGDQKSSHMEFNL